MHTPSDIVIQLFNATDKQDWDKVESLFASNVLLDYSSMNGNPAADLSPKQITDAWKTILPGFEHTHHQLGNFESQGDEDKAEVFCYGNASHYLESEAGSLWLVVGSYDFGMSNTSEGWKIDSMKFNFKYQSGNTQLPELAIERAKN